MKSDRIEELYRAADMISQAVQGDSFLGSIHNIYKSIPFSANYMQIQFVVSVLVCVVVSITIITYAHSQLIQNVIAANTTSTSSLSSANGSNITLGSPQTYTEYSKNTLFRPAIVNGTNGIQIAFTGHGIMNGTNITDSGKAFSTSIGGSIYTTGRGTALQGFTFQGIGHYGADGKLRHIGTIFNTRGMVGIYKDVIDNKNGNATTKVWFWK
jgi:hypothetical protein